jgi:hypothetical protein
MIGTVIVFTVLGLMLFMSVIISGLLVKRATYQVIDRFCSFDALEPGKAKNMEQLGLVPPGLFERLFRPRDYKPYALQGLSKAGFVRATQEGKLYLVEEKLNDKLKCGRP